MRPETAPYRLQSPRMDATPDNPSEMPPAEVAALLLAMARDDDPTLEGQALNWRESKPYIRQLATAVTGIMAESVC